MRDIAQKPCASVSSASSATASAFTSPYMCIILIYLGMRSCALHSMLYVSTPWNIGACVLAWKWLEINSHVRMNTSRVCARYIRAQSTESMQRTTGAITIIHGPMISLKTHAVRLHALGSMLMMCACVVARECARVQYAPNNRARAPLRATGLHRPRPALYSLTAVFVCVCSCVCVRECASLRLDCNVNSLDTMIYRRA